jgi:hypothetical protein
MHTVRGTSRAAWLPKRVHTLPRRNSFALPRAVIQVNRFIRVAPHFQKREKLKPDYCVIVS